MNISQEYIKTLNRGMFPGVDGKKMSKSYMNTVSLFASDMEIRRWIMSIPTNDSIFERMEKLIKKMIP